MTWDTQNERMAVVAAGLGGTLLGLLPAADGTFPWPELLLGDGGDLGGDEGGTAAGTVNRFDWVSEYGLRPRRMGAI